MLQGWSAKNVIYKKQWLVFDNKSVCVNAGIELPVKTVL